ncbi:MAG: site-specific DNA-methyltransferase, partial [Armatimonadetes bacterium]|nr:site-specific DNA-methyltransferase [Armatimonadota bacterium]
QSAKQSWEEWQVPRELPKGVETQHFASLHADWWRIRRERQKEIDASIAKRADTELLYDQPYEDNKRIRVAGPFTVESLSPHRVLAADDAPNPKGPLREDPSGFVQTILDNLKKAGVQNMIKNERLKFDSLEPYAGTWIQAAGEYAEVGADPRVGPVVKRVAISIGPEYGTVGPEQVKEAAKEAVQGVGFDLLIVCGFAFDPHVSEEAKRYDKLTVLIARMNPDLAMGEELLKKTGAGNLFMVFGEPDVIVRRVGAIHPAPAALGRRESPLRESPLQVEIKGVDVYDPTTGSVRSGSADDIACWFVDTNYNGESFFVRHAYFTGADEPYEKLKRALRAEIDEAAWSALYSTRSLPFDPPRTGKIAVKVINHYGDEVMKVYEVK